MQTSKISPESFCISEFSDWKLDSKVGISDPFRSFTCKITKKQAMALTHNDCSKKLRNLHELQAVVNIITNLIIIIIIIIIKRWLISRRNMPGDITRAKFVQF